MTLGALISYVLFQLLIPLLFLLSLLTFVWGTFLVFVAGGADEELADTGKSLMLYGVAWLAITMLAWWGLDALAGGL